MTHGHTSVPVTIFLSDCFVTLWQSRLWQFDGMPLALERWLTPSGCHGDAYGA